MSRQMYLFTQSINRAERRRTGLLAAVLLLSLFLTAPAFAQESEGTDSYEQLDPVSALVGQKLSFTTTSPDGTIYTSKELFGINEITMVNCWGTWCPYCLMELEDLAQIHSSLQEKGCGVLGFELENEYTEDVYELGSSILKEAGADYPNVLMPDELASLFYAYPTTFFVDREGTVLSEPIVGAQVDLYEPEFEKLYEAAADETETETEDASSAYQVRVTDEEGPVEGVMIQFCDESACSMQETDADGVAAFDMPQGTDYEVHVLTVPDGYQDDEEVYHFEDGARELEITLQKEA